MMLKLIKFIVVVILLELSNVNVNAVQWKPVWRDDFNGASGSLPSESNWQFELGTGGPDHWGNNEVEDYTKDPKNVHLDGKGNLLITPLYNGSTWTSARLQTVREDFKAPAGGMLAIEGRIQIPDVTGDKALGYWPAFWSLGAPIRHGSQWPGVGEFDFMENVNGVNKAWGTLHCGVATGGPCNEKSGLGSTIQCPGSPCTSAFHVYRFEWDDTGKIFRWYVDGKNYHSVTKDKIGASTWDQLTSHGYFLLLNVAMGGVFPDSVAGKKTPTSSTEQGHSMVIDYVAVYSS